MTETRTLLLSPHNDDETLFAAYTCLRYRPHVVVLLKSQVQEDRGYGITADQREAETAAAIKTLGCTWEQWPFLDTAPDWEQIRLLLAGLRDRYDQVFAPAVEPVEQGHEQHDAVGWIADQIFPNVHHYLTYSRTAGKSVWGRKVDIEPGWENLKRQALECYRSQIDLGNTAAHFTRPQDEYLA